MSETAIEPSPTALATRLIEPRRATSPGDEDAGHARLQHVGVALERPAVLADVGTGEDEAALVARDGPRQPVCPRDRPDEDEAGVDLLGRLGAVGAADAQALQVTVPPSAATARERGRTSTLGSSPSCSTR